MKSVKSVYGYCLLLALALFAVAPAAVASNLEAQEPYARSTPPGMQNSAAYFVLRNHGNQPRHLVAVASSVAAKVELHTHLHEDGMMMMRQVESVEVPRRGVVKLEPGGLHVMLLGLKHPLEPGQHIDLTLQFDDGSSLELRPEVRHPSGHAPQHGHHHH